MLTFSVGGPAGVCAFLVVVEVEEIMIPRSLASGKSEMSKQ